VLAVLAVSALAVPTAAGATPRALRAPSGTGSAQRVAPVLHVKHTGPRTVVVDARSTRLPRGHRLASAVIDFGDHHRSRLASLKRVVKHRYARVGAYVARLTVVDSTGQEAVGSASVIVIAPASAAPPPSASLAFDADSGPEVVVGDDSTNADASGSVAPAGASLLSATLAYGDGTVVGFTGNPSRWQDDHTYGHAGTFTATLRVVDDDGQVGTTSTVVHAFDPPSLSITGPQVPVPTGAPVVLALSANLPPGASWLAYAVDLGDGRDGTSFDGPPPATYSHVFDAPGVYVITIAAESDSGGTAVASQPITVV
jgi:hypothetical protein